MYYGSFIIFLWIGMVFPKPIATAFQIFVLGILVVETGGGVQRRVAAVIF
jgi:hypothetical protein